jgi:hypothetical protein
MNKRSIAGYLTVPVLSLFAAGCQSPGPVYQTYFVPTAEGTDSAAAQAQCDSKATAEAQSAFDTAYRMAEVNLSKVSTETQTNAGGLAMTPAERQALMAAESAVRQARVAYNETRMTVIRTCMAERRFREASVCVSRCPQ